LTKREREDVRAFLSYREEGPFLQKGDKKNHSSFWGKKEREKDFSQKKELESVQLS